MASRPKAGRVTAIPLGRRLPVASSNLPGRLIRMRIGIAPAPFLFGLAPGGVCHAASVAGSAVRSYRTVSPLPRLKRNAPRRSALCCTVPGVLSPPDVIRHRLPVEPGLSSPAAFRHWRGAAVRPTDETRNGDTGATRQASLAGRLKKPAPITMQEATQSAPDGSQSARAASGEWKHRQCRQRAPAENAAEMR